MRSQGVADMCVYEGTPPSDWDRQVIDLGGCGFHTVQWSIYSASYNRSRPLYFLILDHRGDAAAMAHGLVTERRPLGLRIHRALSLGSLPAARFQEDRERAICEIVYYARCHHFSSVAFQSFGTPFRSEILESGSFSLTKRWEFLVDLPPGAVELWKALDGKKRNMIRKAEKEGVEIRRGGGYSDLLKFRELAVCTRDRKRRQGIAFPDPGEERRFLLMQQQLLDPGFATLYLASAQGKVVAGAVLVHFHDMVYYILSAADEEGLRRAAPDLILWKAMQEAIEGGYRIFNLGGLSESELHGAQLEDAGLYRFKVRFSAEVHQSWRAECILQPRLHRAYLALRTMRRALTP